MTDFVTQTRHYTDQADKLHGFAEKSTDPDEALEWRQMAHYYAKHARDMHAHHGNTAEADRLDAMALHHFDKIVEHHTDTGNYEKAADMYAGEGSHAYAGTAYRLAADQSTNDPRTKLGLLQKALGHHSMHIHTLRQNNQPLPAQWDHHIANLHQKIINIHDHDLGPATPEARHAKLAGHTWLADYYTHHNRPDRAQAERTKAIAQHNGLKQTPATTNKAWHTAELRQLHKQSYEHHLSALKHATDTAAQQRHKARMQDHHQQMRANTGLLRRTFWDR